LSAAAAALPFSKPTWDSSSMMRACVSVGESEATEAAGKAIGTWVPQEGQAVVVVVVVVVVVGVVGREGGCCCWVRTDMGVGVVWACAGWRGRALDWDWCRRYCY
jgi:hypothetical protein